MRKTEMNMNTKTLDALVTRRVQLSCELEEVNTKIRDVILAEFGVGAGSGRARLAPKARKPRPEGEKRSRKPFGFWGAAMAHYSLVTSKVTFTVDDIREFTGCDSATAIYSAKVIKPIGGGRLVLRTPYASNSKLQKVVDTFKRRHGPVTDYFGSKQLEEESDDPAGHQEG